MSTAELMEGCNAGDASSAALEQGRTKLLLAHLPKGSSTPFEMRKRLGIWRNHCFLGLLERIEEQHATATASPRTRRARGARARAMARSGAYRKSVQSLTTVTAQLSADEQKRWATELLPDTGRAGTGLRPLHGTLRRREFQRLTFS